MSFVHAKRPASDRKNSVSTTPERAKAGARVSAMQSQADAAPQSTALQQLVQAAASSPAVGSAAALQRAADQSAVPIQAGKGVMQLFDAGIGDGWHIHYGEHVKYSNNNATRVNFGGRTRRQIGYQWEQVIQGQGLAHTKVTADFIACKTWIRNHIA